MKNPHTSYADLLQLLERVSRIPLTKELPAEQVKAITKDNLLKLNDGIIADVRKLLGKETL